MAYAILAVEREARGEDHPWTVTVLRFVDDLNEVTITEILEPRRNRPNTAPVRSLDIHQSLRSRANSNAVAGILKANGWERSGKFASGPWKGQARFIRRDSGISSTE